MRGVEEQIVEASGSEAYFSMYAATMSFDVNKADGLFQQPAKIQMNFPLKGGIIIPLEIMQRDI